MLSRYLMLAIFSLTLFFCCAPKVNACSCGRQPTVLQALDASDEVVIAKTISVEKAGDAEKERYIAGVRSATMIIEKVFKGNLKVRDEIVFGQGGGADCLWTYDEESIGEQSLLYLKRPDNFPAGPWLAFTCGRSRDVANATDDLLYLENMNKFRGKTRISGTYGGWMNPNVDVAGKKIKIIAAQKTYVTKTDKNGVFEIYDLPPGKYFIEPETPTGWKVSPDWLWYSPSVVFKEEREPEMRTPNQIAIVLEPKKHAGVDIVFQIDNAVRGRVLGPKAKPLNNVCVFLLDPKEGDEGPGTCTGRDGRFEIRAVPPGTYVLVANRDGKLSISEPFPKLYYPNVTERERAMLISIGAGESVDDLNFVIPKLEQTITIEGVLRYSDGTPVADEWVKFRGSKNSDKVDGDSSATTDEEGRFSLKILKGLSGEVAGDQWIFQGAYKKCPKVDELLAATGKRDMNLRSNVIKINGEENMFGVELTFPIPFCEKKE